MHVGNPHLLAVGCARRPRDALVHQRAAQVVCAGAQRLAHAGAAHLDPGGLNIDEVRRKRQPRHGVHEYRLAQCRPGPRVPAPVERSFMSDEGQRHELGESAGALLQVAQRKQVDGPVPVHIDVAEHDRRGGAQSDLMRGFDDLKPLPRVELVRAENLADVVDQNLGSGTRKAAETFRAQQRQVFAQRHAQGAGAVPHFQR